MRLLRAVLRAVAWSGLAAGAITTVMVWRSAPEMRLAPLHVATWLAVFWGLSFVPCLALELGMAHLQVELGAPPQEGPKP
jgi:hypothetical protein